jgi:hypothetical protein
MNRTKENAMRNSLLIVALIFAPMFLISGCGGGSAPAPAATRAVLKLSTQGSLPTGTLIGTIENITITLPAGVTVPTDATGKVLTVSASGQTASSLTTPLIESVYTPATVGSRATLLIRMVVANGFNVGEFATVTCDIGGNVPTAADFSIDQATFLAKDLNAVNITGLSASFALSLI